MELNEMIDKIWDHFVVKKNPKSINKEACSYMGCAIAICLPKPFQEMLIDREKSGDFPGPIRFLFSTYPKEIKEFFPQIDVEILAAIESIHDCTDAGENFHKEIERKLRNFAELFRIPIPV